MLRRKQFNRSKHTKPAKVNKPAESQGWHVHSNVSLHCSDASHTTAFEQWKQQGGELNTNQTTLPKPLTTRVPTPNAVVINELCRESQQGTTLLSGPQLPGTQRLQISQQQPDTVLEAACTLKAGCGKFCAVTSNQAMQKMPSHVVRGSARTQQGTPNAKGCLAIRKAGHFRCSSLHRRN